MIFYFIYIKFAIVLKKEINLTEIHDIIKGLCDGNGNFEIAKTLNSDQRNNDKEISKINENVLKY